MYPKARTAAGTDCLGVRIFSGMGNVWRGQRRRHWGQSCIYIFYHPLHNNLSTSTEQSLCIQRKGPAMSSPFAENTQWVMAFTFSLSFHCSPKVRAIWLITRLNYHQDETSNMDCRFLGNIFGALRHRKMISQASCEQHSWLCDFSSFSSSVLGCCMKMIFNAKALCFISLYFRPQAHHILDWLQPIWFH